MIALRYAGCVQLMLDTADHASHFPHVFGAVSVVRAIRFGIKGELSTLRNTLMLRWRVGIDATHVGHFPLVYRAVVGLQYLAYRIKCAGNMPGRNTQVKLVTDKVALAPWLSAVHMNKHVGARHFELIDSRPASVIFTQRALCDLVSRCTVIQGETSLSVGKYLSLIQATQFSPVSFLTGGEVNWVFSFKLSMGLLTGITLISCFRLRFKMQRWQRH